MTERLAEARALELGAMLFEALEQRITLHPTATDEQIRAMSRLATTQALHIAALLADVPDAEWPSPDDLQAASAVSANEILNAVLGAPAGLN